MTGIYLLDWAIMAISLFNTILLLWLGLTVLLNAERRTWGIWLAGGGLLLGGLFFVSHSAILGYGLTFVGQGMEFWWRVGWLPVVGSPFVWYLVMLWYAGFWDDKQSDLRRRQRPWLLLTVLLAIGLVGLLLFANPLPSYSQVAQLRLSVTPAIGGLPLLMLVYPLYIVLCIGLSLDVLRRPEPSGRVMGDLARRRARPWLVATSATLLIVSLLVAWVMVWIVFNAGRGPVFGVHTDMALTVGWFDLIIAGLIALAVILLGQAVVSYEIFTGKALPRRGLRQQWRRAIILAGGYGLAIGWSLTTQLRPIYGLLLSTLLIILFYALLSWRSYAERERYMGHLRPFMASQRLYDNLLSGSGPGQSEVDITIPFRALCEDVLGARRAYLMAAGPLAPLAGSPLAYPDRMPTLLPSLTELVAKFDSAQTMCLPLEPSQYNGARWAVPLWSERGLIGLLLLGEKRDGGLYAQEEIEIARASGERLIDLKASTEIARRLVILQRQRLAESQVIDQQARRVLHDDVLPRLHATMLTLSNSEVNRNGASADTVSILADLHRRISDLLLEMPKTTSPEVARLGLIGALRQVVDNELSHAFDSVTWKVTLEAKHEIPSIPPLMSEVLFFAAREVIRNAAHHGRTDKDNPLLLIINVSWPQGMQIVIQDNGVGFAEVESAANGGGQGLALHSTMMAVVGGSLAVESTLGAYTRVVLSLPQKTW